MEHLIEEVRKRPILWDSRREQYKDATQKDKQWEEIAHILEKESKYKQTKIMFSFNTKSKYLFIKYL